MRKALGNRLAFALLAGLVGFASVPALAGSGDASKDPATIDELFKKFDRDANGGISFDEFTAQRGERFKKYDANADDKITLEEFTAGVAADKLQGRKDRFAKLDANGDGVLTLEDGAERSRAQFQKIDTSGDGKVNLAEFTAAVHPVQNGGTTTQ